MPSNQAPYFKEISFRALSGGQSIKVTLAAGSQKTAAIDDTTAVVTPDTSVFFRAGNPASVVAVNTGADEILLAGNSYRLDIDKGQALAFIPVSGSAGNVYITPGV